MPAVNYDFKFWLEASSYLKQSSRFDISFSGAGIYSSGALPNNSLITTIPPRNITPSFRCLSGSSAPSVGKLIGPLGNDITLNPSDPFFVSRGGSYDPGTMLVRGLQPLQWEDTGIYTYRTPDENGNIVDFHFGIYYPDYSST